MSRSSTNSPLEGVPRVQVKRPLKRRQLRKKPYINILKLRKEFLGEKEDFIKNFGVTQMQFQSLYSLLSGQVNISLSKFRFMQTIRGRDRLALCLRFLATGDSLQEISDFYSLQPGIMETITREVSLIIIQELRPVVMPRPSRKMWEKISLGFKELHDMPNCLGSLNGRYVDFLNQNIHTFLALVDAHHRFIMVDLCEYDVNPQKTWAKSMLSQRLYSKDLNIPNNRSPGKNFPPLPFVIVGGNSFPSETHMISKFKEAECEGDVVKTAYNNRINIVKQMADEAFVRLHRRWRIIQSPFPVSPANAERMLMATCCLQNFLSGPAIWHKAQPDVNVCPQVPSVQNIASFQLMNTRDKYVQYFCSHEGTVPWQLQYMD